MDISSSKSWERICAQSYLSSLQYTLYWIRISELATNPFLFWFFSAKEKKESNRAFSFPSPPSSISYQSQLMA